MGNSRIINRTARRVEKKSSSFGLKSQADDDFERQSKASEDSFSLKKKVEPTATTTTNMPP